MRIVSLLILFLACSILFTSCDREDEDVVPMEDLSNTKIKSVTIINVPPFYWDNGSSPDLYLTLSSTSDPSIVYTTNQVNNVEIVPQNLDFPQAVPMTNELWELKLLDHDVLNADDVIYIVSFNPYNGALAGKVPIYNDGILLMEFNYTKQ